jgi:hypothetical protein
MTRDEFAMLWNDVHKVLVSYSFILAQGRPEDGYVNPNQLESYLDNLDMARAIAHDDLIVTVFQNSANMKVTKEDFVAKLGPKSKLFRSYGYREFVYDWFLKMPRAQASLRTE